MSNPANHFSIHSLFSRKKASKAVDGLAYLVGIVGNAAIIPQIIEAWQSPAPGMAIATWMVFTFISIIWLVYAIVHKQKPLITAQTVALICNVLVVGGWLFNHL